MELDNQQLWLVTDAASHRRAVQEILKIMDRVLDATATPMDKQRLEAFRIFIAEYERTTVRFPDLPPHELVAAALAQEGLQQKDIAELMGGPSRVSEFLSQKRPLTKEQMVKLSQRFNLPMEKLVERELLEV